MSTWVVVLFAVAGVRLACVGCVDLQEQLNVLSKRDRTIRAAEEDIRIIEDNIRRSIYDSPELIGMRDEVKHLRDGLGSENVGEVEQLRSGKIPKPHLEKNDQLTVKWIFNTVEELKNRSDRTPTTLNSSVIPAEPRTELENARRQNAKYEAGLEILREEFQSIKENWRSTMEMCGKTKNQLIEMQHEWNQNWKIWNEKSPQINNEMLSHPTRHQKIIKQHIIKLRKSSKTLLKENYALKTKFVELEDELKRLKSKLDLSNFDKLHLSMLELLENVETIENKVDKNFPEFRHEMSKLDVQISETASAVSLLKEDQKNIIESLKAISFTVSNMQDKTNEDHKYLEEVDTTVKQLVKSSSVQTSKLHDHILKEESRSVNVNASRATVHLVQELRSFESEYKSIVNKLPRDCATVDGPSGIYLISPGDGEPILAHCEDGWTTIQKRYDGSINFNRNWNEYSNGFGSVTGEHWLGNRNLNYLTKSNCSQLQINMKDIYGKYWQANYADIRVADYTHGFKLYVGRYSGNASDAFDYQNMMEFSTFDNDRDISNTHCASNYEGGWWFSHCQHANLNGRYNLGLTWFDSSRNEWIAVSNSEMRLKRRDVC
ncbi:hypothetical protein NQ317_003174 [Molorchus minor]|uniref:Fibrinogen C-terminal domain-containing protein n=1 Tax=Molorchus minor TaxID=1323400 RepID=A0ABQ9ISZ4_9CUCU|nr:hypothetical protein NQ317_003174 [Molorchus minor]